MKFVSFHSHDTHSHADALGSTETHVARVASLGMTALGMSNHGNVNNHAALEQACAKHDIKPIYGVEAYFSPAIKDKAYQRKTHLTIFAMNEVGYHNLNKIVTQSFVDFYQWPTVSWENLKEHNEGIVVLSGCADSLISCTLLGGKFLGEGRSTIEERDLRNAHRRIQQFVRVFGDRFYLEVQRFPHYDRTCTLNPALLKLSADTGVPLIATADVHYPFPYQNKTQAILHAARWNSDPGAQLESSWEHSANLTYPESDEEIINDLMETGLNEIQSRDAVFQTEALARRCTVELPKAKPLRFKTTDGQSSKRELRLRIRSGWKTRCEQRPNLVDRQKEYYARVDQEFKTVCDKDFADYFLAIAQLVNLAKDRDTDVGPARGSAAASLICYLLGITEIDPLHPLFDRMIFERFLDPNRKDPPDIDLDFDDGKRIETEHDARKIYGPENVANVALHTGYRGRRSLDDVCRAYKLPLSTFKAIKKRIPDRVETDDRVDDSIKDVLESYKDLPEIATLIATYPDQLHQAMELEGNEHSMGIHACGYVIASSPIPEVCAIYTKTKGTGRNKQEVQVIPYDKRDAEYLRMLKVDFLGSSTMGAIGLMREWGKVSLEDLYVLIYKEYDKWLTAQDRTTFKANTFDNVLKKFCKDDVVGIMQYEGPTTRQVVKNVQPKDFHELAACGALSRPGPYYGGQYRDYVAVKNGEKDWERVGKGFDEHVEWTYGQIVYQEQIMWILRDLGGFDVDEVLKVRKIIGKKLGEFQFAVLYAQFRDGCAANGVDESSALRVWGAITTAAGYAFNTAHAYSYALIAWWQMWFKMNHTLPFFAATLAKNGDGKDDIPRRTAVLQDCEAHDIAIGGWDVNNTDENWKPFWGSMVKGTVPMGQGGTMIDATKWRVMPGFQQIPGIAEATSSDIVKWRKELPFALYPNVEGREAEQQAWWDLMASDPKKGGCSGIGDVTVEKIKAFISRPDALGVNRTRDQLETFRKQLADGDFGNTALPPSELYARSTELPGHTKVAFVGLISNTIFRDEIETIRNKTGQSVDEIKASMKDPDKTKKATLFAYDEYGEVALRVSRWLYPKLGIKIGAIVPDHHIVVAYGDTYETNANSIQVKTIWVLQPD